MLCTLVPLVYRARVLTSACARAHALREMLCGFSHRAGTSFTYLTFLVSPSTPMSGSSMTRETERERENGTYLHARPQHALVSESSDSAMNVPHDMKRNVCTEKRTDFLR